MKTQKEQYAPLLLEKIYSLSNEDYSVYYIVYDNQRIGYFGIYSTGKFNYSILENCIDEKELVRLIKVKLKK
jgi:hypothetical protein